MIDKPVWSKRKSEAEIVAAGSVDPSFLYDLYAEAKLASTTVV